MKLIELKCKNCNASLEIEDSATSVTCKYCHSKFLVDDEVRATSKMVKDSVDIAKNELKEERKTGLKIGVSIAAIAIIGLVILGGALSRKSLDNKKKIIPCALNIGIKAAKGIYIVNGKKVLF